MKLGGSLIIGRPSLLTECKYCQVVLRGIRERGTILNTGRPTYSKASSDEHEISVFDTTVFNLNRHVFLLTLPVNCHRTKKQCGL
jgi:hypothetical protein